jgi:hypothetical protein
MQPFPTTNKACQFISLSPTGGEVYLIQYYMIKFVSDLLKVGCILLVFPFLLSIKPAAHDIKWNIINSSVNHLFTLLSYDNICREMYTTGGKNSDTHVFVSKVWKCQIGKIKNHKLKDRQYNTHSQKEMGKKTNTDPNPL